MGDFGTWRREPGSPILEAESWTPESQVIEEDLSALREPIHKVFASWMPNPEDILVFTKRYGVLWSDESCLGQKTLARQRGTGLRIREERQFIFSPERWRDAQQTFQRWWREPLSGKHVEEMKSVLVYEPYSDRPPARLELSTGRKGKSVVELTAPDLWHYMVLLLLSERAEMIRVCRNEKCSAPYYIAQRKDQQYCTSDCSQAVATRRWWTLHGNEWRRKRKLKGKRGKR